MANGSRRERSFYELFPGEKSFMDFDWLRTFFQCFEYSSPVESWTLARFESANWREKTNRIGKMNFNPRILKKFGKLYELSRVLCIDAWEDNRSKLVLESLRNSGFRSKKFTIFSLTFCAHFDCFSFSFRCHFWYLTRESNKKFSSERLLEMNWSLQRNNLFLEGFSIIFLT